ncbi:histidine--tRNA ligase [Calditerrivibrio sp.]|uniref:histidine--tRNA ligase n=1 Tax=Calditerrivibrio sp. TaxID=2792612 RepID=UPI003D14A99A
MFTRVKGFRDIFGDEIPYWHKVEKSFHKVFKRYEYTEFKLPVLEKVEVFQRGIGDTTDIVEKEMFVFDDKGGDRLALRPEGTASIVRGYIENRLYTGNAIAKYYYYGPMFRRERPQKGRFRQFYQVGIEAFGSSAPSLDAEVIKTMQDIFDECGILDIVSLNINSIGCPKCRPLYKEKLISYLTDKKDQLCDDCLNRLNRNPLRVLDCKIDRCKSATRNAPKMVDHLCDECNSHFEKTKQFLTFFNIKFNIDPFMVRGLDYYVKTAFEFVTDRLGASSAVGGGGRYDGLIKTLGGPDIPGIGYAIGVDRLVTLMMEKNIPVNRTKKVFVVFFEETFKEGFEMIELLRKNDISTGFDYEFGNFKNQFKKADRNSADWVIIIGTSEKERGIVQLKDMKTGVQFEVKKEEIIEKLTL